MAGYSLFTYIFGVKDRHNGNILLDRQGHMIHIDFGFILQNTPGGMNFESAPFKLTQEYVDLMDGADSDKFEMFRSLLQAGLEQVRKNLDEILTLVTIMMKDSKMPCFKNTELLVKEIKDRICTKDIIIDNKTNEFYELSDRLAKASNNNWRTI